MSIVGETLGSRSHAIGPHAGIIITSPATLSEKVWVVLPTYDSQYKWGPCAWMPRGSTLALPQAGDRCLVIFDETKTPWVTAWWPF